MSCVQLSNAWNQLTLIEKGDCNQKIFSQIPEFKESFNGLVGDDFKHRLQELAPEFTSWKNGRKAVLAAHSKLERLYDIVSMVLQ